MWVITYEGTVFNLGTGWVVERVPEKREIVAATERGSQNHINLVELACEEDYDRLLDDFKKHAVSGEVFDLRRWSAPQDELTPATDPHLNPDDNVPALTGRY